MSFPGDQQSHSNPLPVGATGVGQAQEWNLWPLKISKIFQWPSRLSSHTPLLSLWVSVLHRKASGYLGVVTYNNYAPDLQHYNFLQTLQF